MPIRIRENEYKGVKSRVRRAVHGAKSLDEVEANFRREFPGYFVYRGGDHVSLHLTSSSSRYALVVDR